MEQAPNPHYSGGS